MTQDYIPKRDQEMAVWMQNFVTTLNAAPAAYGLLPADVTPVIALVDSFVDELGVATNPATRTTPTVQAKETAKKLALAGCRGLARRVQASPAVSDTERALLGLTVRKVPSTPIPAPSVQPLLGLRSQIPGVAIMEYAVPDEEGKAKPFGAIGVELWVAVGVAAAVDPAAATYRATATKSPFRITFDNADKGRTATVFGRFVTRSGPGGLSQPGPWSTPISFVVN